MSHQSRLFPLLSGVRVITLLGAVLGETVRDGSVVDQLLWVTSVYMQLQEAWAGVWLSLLSLIPR